MFYPIDHQAFTSQPKPAISSRATVVYPIGAGGQFLLGHLTGDFDHDVSVNEYRANAVTWLLLERWLSGISDDGVAIECGDLLHDAAAWYGAMPADDLRYTVSHTLPWLTSKLFDYNCDELMVIEIDPTYDLFIACLIYYKSRFSNNMEAHKLASLLNHMQDWPPGRLDPTSYQITMRNLMKDGISLPISNTAIGWMYYIECLHHGRDPRDRQNLTDYLTGQFILFNDIVRTVPLREHQTMMIGDLTGHCQRITVLDYADLFMDLRIPSGSLIGTIPIAEVAAYSMRNIQMARRLCTAMDDRMASRLRDMTNLMADRLVAACDRLQLRLARDGLNLDRTIQA